jgi:hypothetical protein
VSTRTKFSLAFATREFRTMSPGWHVPPYGNAVETKRFVSLALRLLELGYRLVHLAAVIGAVLRYDYPEDEQAAELQETIRAEGERSVLAQYAGIGEGHPLKDLVVDRLDRT